MADSKRAVFVLKFAQKFVYLVDYLIHPEVGAKPAETENCNELFNPLQTFLNRYKMELYFVFAEEIVRFEKGLTNESLKELFQSIITELKEDEYDSQVLSWYCVVLSYYAAISKRRGVDKAPQTAVRTLVDVILYFEKNNKIDVDVVEDIKESLKKTEQLIDVQKTSSN